MKNKSKRSAMFPWQVCKECEKDNQIAYSQFGINQEVCLTSCLEILHNLKDDFEGV